MLLTLLYHRAMKGKYGNSPEMLKEHLTHLARRYDILLPGEVISPFKVQLCLTFDDGTYDLYEEVFPLLKELKIRAVFAIPSGWVEEPMNSIDIRKPNRKYCSWDELKEMVDSGLVKIASHSYYHPLMTLEEVDLPFEVIESKNLLEKKLKIEVDTFVYPYGRFNSEVHQLVKKHYKYVMRIGSAMNWSWTNFDGMIYRISCDQLRSKMAPLMPWKFLHYSSRFLFNSIRGK